MSQKFLLVVLTGILGLAFSFIINPGAAQAQSIDCFTSRQAAFQENICVSIAPGVVITQASLGSVVYIQGIFSSGSNQVLFFDSGSGGTGTVRAEAPANVISPPEYTTAISQLSFAVPSTHYNPVTKQTEPVLPGTYDLVVQTSAGTSNVKQFTIIPLVTNISPKSGAIGALVTINGSGFNLDVSKNKVDFGVQKATILSATSTELKVIVPALSPATYGIRVFSGNVEASYNVNQGFTVSPHLESFVKSNQGLVDENFTIEGKVFSITPGNNKIFFSGKEISTPLSSTVLTLTAKVPDLPLGWYAVRISVREGNTQNWIESDNFLNFKIAGKLPKPTFVIDPFVAMIYVNQTQQFIGLYDPDGSDGAVPEQDKTAEAQWSSAKPKVVTIDNGLATCLVGGAAFFNTPIQATYSGITATANLVCLAEGVAPPVAPAAPTTAPTGLSPSGTGIPLTPTLSWQPVSGATSYQWKITRKETGYLIFEGTTTNQTSVTAIGGTLLTSQSYTLEVRACNVGGCGDPASSTFTTIPQPGVPGAPGGVTVPSFPFLKCDKPYEPKGNAIGNPLCAGNIQDLIDAIIKFIFWIAIVLAPVMILIGAFYYVTSAGDTKRITTAKNIILYTVIGLAIILFSRGLIAVIRGVLGG